MNVKSLSLIMFPLIAAVLYVYFITLELNDYLSTTHLVLIVLFYRYIHEYVHLIAIPSEHKITSSINHKYGGLVLYVEASPHMTKIQATIFSLAPLFVLSVIPLSLLYFTGINSTIHAVVAATGLFNIVASSSDIQETWHHWRGGSRLTRESLDKS